jgi:hypothetical protein
MEDGYSTQAAQYSRRTIIRDVEFIVCDPCAFRAWVRDDLCHGAKHFMWLEPTCGKVVRTKIVKGNVSYEAVNASLSVEKVKMQFEHWDC